MKQLELNSQKRLLIVEVDKMMSKYNTENWYQERLSKGLKLICKGSELTEEIAKELVKNGKINEFDIYYNYKMDCWLYENKTTIDSFISAIEAQGYYWGENPLGDYSNALKRHILTGTWQEAESKTFNLSKTLIFEIL